MKRMSEGHLDGRVAHAFHFVDKDVRRFFQSPVDAAPGTVDVHVREQFDMGCGSYSNFLRQANSWSLVAYDRVFILATRKIYTFPVKEQARIIFNGPRDIPRATHALCLSILLPKVSLQGQISHILHSRCSILISYCFSMFPLSTLSLKLNFSLSLIIQESYPTQIVNASCLIAGELIFVREGTRR